MVVALARADDRHDPRQERGQGHPGRRVRYHGRHDRAVAAAAPSAGVMGTVYLLDGLPTIALLVAMFTIPGIVEMCTVPSIQQAASSGSSLKRLIYGMGAPLRYPFATRAIGHLRSMDRRSAGRRRLCRQHRRLQSRADHLAARAPVRGRGRARGRASSTARRRAAPTRADRWPRCSCSASRRVDGGRDDGRADPEGLGGRDPRWCSTTGT